MRLIDADELLEYFADAPDMSFENFHTPISTLRQLIADMPTIAPESLRPVGQWKPYYDYFTKRQVGWICTNCSGVQDDLSNGDTNYCPNCGALMEGETK